MSATNKITDVTATNAADFFAAVNLTESQALEEAALLAELEAAEAAAAAEAQAIADQAKADAGPAEDVVIEDEAVVMPHVPGDIKELVSNITHEAKEQRKAEIVSEFAARKAFEESQVSISSKMIPNLDAAEKALATIGAAGLMLALDIDPGFINRSVAVGSRYNVYAFGKLKDLITALEGGFLQTPVNRAIVASLFNCRDAGIPFTGPVALAAASDKLKVDRAIAKHLVRHTLSPSTASTQKSSTMVALSTLGVVVNTGTQGREVWQLTDTPATRRLEEVIRKVA